MPRTKLLMVAAITLTLIGSGCATKEVQYLPEPLPLPARPVLPKISPEEIECLDKDTYMKLMWRDFSRRFYAEKLEAIIRATHHGLEAGR